MILLTSRTCQPCSALKAMYQNDKRVTFVEITSEHGAYFAAKHKVRTVPSMIDQDAVIKGAPSIMRYLKEKENA